MSEKQKAEAGIPSEKAKKEETEAKEGDGEEKKEEKKDEKKDEKKVEKKEEKKGDSKEEKKADFVPPELEGIENLYSTKYSNF